MPGAALLDSWRRRAARLNPLRHSWRKKSLSPCSLSLSFTPPLPPPGFLLLLQVALPELVDINSLLPSPHLP